MSLCLDNVGYATGGTRLIKDINLVIDNASITVLIGPNGAGKTTLLRTVSGELVPDSGNILLDSDNIADIELEQRAKRIAFLTQQSMLDFPFKGHEVIQMGRIPHLTGREYNHKVVRAVTDACQLQDLSERIYTTLSGGEQQRIQIGRILCQVWDQMDTAWILFDEPTSALDLSHQLVFFKVVKNLVQRGASIILVLHDINLAARFADNIVLMSDGRILASGPPSAVINSDNIQKAFSVEIDLIVSEGIERPMIQAKVPC